MKTIKGTVLDFYEPYSIVDIEKLKASCMGVILRLGYTGYGSKKPSLDKGFVRLYEQLHNAGIPVGCYYFTIAYNQNMAEMELSWILEQCAKYDFQMPIALDVEPQKNSAGWTNLSRDERTVYVKYILDGISAAGYYTMVYGSTIKTFKEMLDDSKLTAYDHWTAQYAIKNTYTGVSNLWQYSSKASASSFGVKHSGDTIDISNAYIDYPAIIKRKGLNKLKATYEPIPIVTKESIYYKVVRGDTLSKIAIRYKTTVEQIVQDNVAQYPKMTKNYIVVGWTLKVGEK